MKAYEVSVASDDGKFESRIALVFAENASKAKSAAYNEEVACGSIEFDPDYDRYTDIEAHRLPAMDGCEDMSLIDLNTKLIKECNWYFYDDSGREMNADNYNRQTLKKMLEEADEV